MSMTVAVLIILVVEGLKEYQQARRIPAWQCFVSDLERRDETCAYIMTDTKCFIVCFGRRSICTKC
jgi:hypothetical protein